MPESSQQEQLGRTRQALLLAPTDACRCASKARLTARANFNEDPFSPIAHDQVDLARLESNIAIDGLQALATQQFERA